jgi:hypothetical protein
MGNAGGLYSRSSSSSHFTSLQDEFLPRPWRISVRRWQQHQHTSTRDDWCVWERPRHPTITLQLRGKEFMCFTWLLYVWARLHFSWIKDLVIISCSTRRFWKSFKNPRTSAAKLTCKEITTGLVQSLAAHAQTELYIQAPLQQIDIIV